MLSLLTSSLFALVVFGVFMAAFARVTWRLWAGRAYLGVVYGLVGVAGVAWVVAAVYWRSPKTGATLVPILAVACVAYLVYTRAFRYWRHVAQVGMLVVVVLFLYLGLTFLWGAPDDLFHLMATRFSHELPVDNLIPTLLADRLQAGESTSLITGDWNGSDRPPLQSGLILMTRALGGGLFGATVSGLGASIAAQFLWIPGLYAALRAWGVARGRIVLPIVFVAVTGTTLVNSVFTWPKLLSAALVLASIAALLDARRTDPRALRSFVLAVLAFVLGALAHGAAVFVVPLVVVLGIRALLVHARRDVLITLAQSVVVGAVAYVPWMLFQRFIDPPGDRLLKWHLGGVTTPDPRGVVELIRDSYSALSLGDWVRGRLANLEALFGQSPLSCYCTSIAERRRAEFFTTAVALELALPLLVAILLVIAAMALRRRPLLANDRRFLFMVGGAALCILLWCAVMFIPGSTVVHQGSQVWVILLLAAPVVWLGERARGVAVAAVLLQAVLMLVLYAPSVLGGSLSVVALVVAVVGAAGVVAITARGLRRARA
jgi:hypothetical protein